MCSVASTLLFRRWYVERADRGRPSRARTYGVWDPTDLHREIITSDILLASRGTASSQASAPPPACDDCETRHYGLTIIPCHARKDFLDHVNIRVNHQRQFEVILVEETIPGKIYKILVVNEANRA